MTLPESPFATVDALIQALERVGYFADRRLATAVFLHILVDTSMPSSSRRHLLVVLDGTPPPSMLLQCCSKAVETLPSCCHFFV
jgi:hypothetical protein